MVSPEELENEAKLKVDAADALLEEAGKLEEQGWQVKADAKLQKAKDLQDEAAYLRQRALLLHQQHPGA